MWHAIWKEAHLPAYKEWTSVYSIKFKALFQSFVKDLKTNLK